MKKKLALIFVIGIFLLIQPISAQTWEEAKRLTWNPGSSSSPSVAADSNNHIHVACQDYTPGNWEIYYKRSSNGGTTWTTKRLTWNTGGSEESAVTIDSNNHIHMVWIDSSSGNYEIYYKKGIQ